MTLGRLASHVAELPGLIELSLTQDELDFAAGTFKPFVATTVAQLLEMFDKNISRVSDLLKSATDEQLMTPWRMRQGERIFFEMPRIAVIRSMGLNHIIHHRGQLSVYLRLQDVPLPSVYGPTADEPM
jgi:uncharacterized damage-inducible protein DinB